MRSIMYHTACFLCVIALAAAFEAALDRYAQARAAAEEAGRIEGSVCSWYAGEKELMRLYGEADLALLQERDPAGLEGIARAGNRFLLTAETRDGALYEAALDLVGPSSGARCALAYAVRRQAAKPAY